MRWLTVTHTQRWHAAHRTSGTGPLDQGRFKSFPIQEDDHLLTVLRYVERNALRANLVERAEEWRWSSLWHRVHGGTAVLAEKLAAFTYPADGRITGIARYADLAAAQLVATSTYSYDSETGRLTGLAHEQGATALAGYAWEYDSAGRLTRQESLLDGAVDYTYDSLGQLTGSDYDGLQQPDESYAYDANGNRTSGGHVAGVNNRLLFDGTFRYEYDAEGNRTLRFVDADSSGTLTTGDTDLTEYAWDHRNRLVQVTERDLAGGPATQTVAYEYDVFNRLVGRAADLDGDGTIDRQQRYVYDGLKIVLEFETSGPGDLAAADLKTRYLWESAVDQLLAQENIDSTPGQAGDVLWPLCDHLGTVRDLAVYGPTTHQTAVENHRVYDAFGSLQSETNPAVDCLFGFTGQMSDEATGLQSNLNRWYDPSTGRWLSEDPIGFSAGDLNLTRYVGNQPTLFVDPLGLHECEHGSGPSGDDDEGGTPLQQSGQILLDEAQGATTDLMTGVNNAAIDLTNLALQTLDGLLQATGRGFPRIPPVPRQTPPDWARGGVNPNQPPWMRDASRGAGQMLGGGLGAKFLGPGRGSPSAGRRETPSLDSHRPGWA